MAKKGQQEMVGFVLIVVLVVVAALVLLVISLRKPAETKNDLQAENLISSVLSYTTECSDYEPNYFNIQRLMKACYNREACTNLGRNSCDYLNESLKDIFKIAVAGESVIKSYDVSVFSKDSEGQTADILGFSSGEAACSSPSGWQEVISASPEDLVFRVRFCY